MSDADAIANMTPEQIATALGGSIILTTESDCDVCQRSEDKTGHDHYLVGFRAGEVTAAGIYCLPCLQSCLACQLRDQADMDRLVEAHHIEQEGCAS